MINNMKMIKYEYKKIFTRPYCYGIILSIVIVCMIIPFFIVLQYKQRVSEFNDLNIGTLEEVYSRYNKSELVEDGYEEILNISSDGTDAIQELVANYYLDVYCSRLYRSTGKMQLIAMNELVERPNEVMCIETIKKKNDLIGREIDDTSYEARDLKQQQEMMEQSKEAQFTDIGLWNKFNQNETIAVFIFTFILIFAFSNIQQQEYRSNMYMILQNSINGKHKQIWMKCLSVYSVCIIGVLVINILLSIIYFGLGTTKGGQVSLVNLDLIFSITPYDITILEYAVYKMIFQSVGLMTLILLEMVISIYAKSKFITALLTLIVLAIGELDSVINISGSNYFSLLGISKALNTREVFYRYRSFNIVGEPVLYPIVMMITMCSFILFLSIFVIHKNYNSNS